MVDPARGPGEPAGGGGGGGGGLGSNPPVKSDEPMSLEEFTPALDGEGIAGRPAGVVGRVSGRLEGLSEVAA